MARAETQVQVGQRHDIPPPHAQPLSAGGLGNSFSVPISHAWDLASGWAGLGGPISHCVGDEGKEISQCVPLTWPIRCDAAVCGGKEPTREVQPGTNHLAGFQEPTTMGSNTISVKQEFCRARAQLRC